MQTAYAPCRDTTRRCLDLRPDTVNFSYLCGKVPDRPNDDIRHDVLVLEAERFFETLNLRSAASGSTLEVLQFVRLSHPLAAKKFLGKPDGQADWQREARTGPQGVPLSADFSKIYEHRVDYRNGRDRLDILAHFYLTELATFARHKSGDGSDRQKPAKAHRIDNVILKARAI